MIDPNPERRETNRRPLRLTFLLACKPIWPKNATSMNLITCKVTSAIHSGLSTSIQSWRSGEWDRNAKYRGVICSMVGGEIKNYFAARHFHLRAHANAMVIVEDPRKVRCSEESSAVLLLRGKRQSSAAISPSWTKTYIALSKSIQRDRLPFVKAVESTVSAISGARQHNDGYTNASQIQYVTWRVWHYRLMRSVEENRESPVVANSFQVLWEPVRFLRMSHWRSLGLLHHFTRILE